MNKQMIVKNVGKHAVLLPQAIRLGDDGSRQRPPADDYWVIEDISDDGVVVFEPRSHHKRLLHYDHIFNYTSDLPKGGAERAFLMLKVQLVVIGNEVKIFPTLRPGEAFAPTLDQLGIDAEPRPAFSQAVALAKAKAFDEETKRLCYAGPEPFYEAAGQLFDALHSGLNTVRTETGWKIIQWDIRVPGYMPEFIARIAGHSLAIYAENLAANSSWESSLQLLIFAGAVVTEPERRQGAHAWGQPKELWRKKAILTRTPHFGWGFDYNGGRHSPIVIADDVLAKFVERATKEK